MKFLAATTLVFCLACGSKGESSNEQAPPSDASTGAIGSGLTPVALTGTVAFSDDEEVSPEYEVWILDHIDGGSARFSLNASGNLKIPLNIFKVDHLYSFHIAKQHRIVANFDFSTATDGAQSGLVYDGGYGFDFGKVSINRNRLGEVDIANPGVTALYGGGFRLDNRTDLGLASLPPPVGVEFFDVVGQLNVFDPVDLRYGFYRRDHNPMGYSDGLREYSRFIVSLKSRFPGTILSLSVLEADNWLAGSRVASADSNASRGSSSLWSAADYKVSAINETNYSSSIFIGEALRSDSFAVFKILPQYGPTLLVPRLIQKMMAVPPLLKAVSLEGGVPLSIDYSSDVMLQSANKNELSGAADGLLVPFCFQEKAIRLAYEPPRDFNGNLMVGPRYGLVDLAIDYYEETSEGRLLQLKVSAQDFSQGFSQKLIENIAPNITRQWDPELATVRFIWADSEASALVNPIMQVMPQVFPLTVGGKFVNAIRVRTYFRHKDHPGEAASAFWMRRGC